MAKNQISLYDLYKKEEEKDPLLLNFKVCKGYFGDPSASVTQIVFLILKRKYDYPWQEKILRKATTAARGVRDAEIDIPQFNYKEKVTTILSKFVKDRFNEIMRKWRDGDYPMVIRDLGERYERIYGVV